MTNSFRPFLFQVSGIDSLDRHWRRLVSSMNALINISFEMVKKYSAKLFLSYHTGQIYDFLSLLRWTKETFCINSLRRHIF